MSKVDDVPANYTVENFRRWNHWATHYAAQGFGSTTAAPFGENQLQLPTDLICDLHDGKEMKSGIDFYMCVVHLFIGEPVLPIKPKENKNPDTGYYRACISYLRNIV